VTCLGLTVNCPTQSVGEGTKPILLQPLGLIYNMYH
jgi:hypothetical protein